MASAPDTMNLSSPRTLLCGDWEFWDEYTPAKFEAFLIASGFRDGRSGVPPVLPAWAKDETERQHNLWRKRGVPGALTYFARGKWTGRIKIGMTRQHPSARVSQLAWANNGEESELLCTRRGQHFEGLYHKAFYAWSLGAEWFAPHPDILAEIARLSSLSGIAGEV